MEKNRAAPRNLWMLLAALLMALTVMVHVFAGGPEIMQPVRASDLAPLPGAVVHVIWHFVTLLLALMAAALVFLWRMSNPPLAVLLIGINLGTALIFLAYGVALLGTVWPMPQWIIFLAVAALITLGLRRA